MSDTTEKIMWAAGIVVLLGTVIIVGFRDAITNKLNEILDGINGAAPAIDGGVQHVSALLSTLT